MSTSRSFFLRCRYILCLVPLSLSSVASSQDSTKPAVRIELGRIDVTLKPAAQRRGLIASVRVAFQLRNTTDKSDQLQRSFPVAASPHGMLGQPQKPWCHVLVDGKPVKFTIKPLIEPASRAREWPNQEAAAVWSRRIEEWIQQDADLLRMVTRYRQLASVQKEMGEVTNTWRDRVKKHLIHLNDPGTAAHAVASGDLYFRYLVNLMPEIDPALRIDGAFQRWKYVSILNDYDCETYRPYELEWRRKADKWFASKPELAELVPRLRELWGSFREGLKLLNGPILKHAHDANGLSLSVALEFRGFIQRGSTAPSPTLMRALFPDIGQKLDARVEDVTRRVRAWGFDQSNISPFTGMLVKDGFAQYRGYRDLWRDASVMSVLERPKPVGSKPRLRRIEEFAQPSLLTFNAPLESQAEVDVTLEYDTPVQFMAHPMGSSFYFRGVPELTCVFPSPRDVQVTVTTPANAQTVIAPAPESVTLLEDGVRRFTTKLAGDNSVLHLLAVGFAAHNNAYVDRFSQRDSRVRVDLEVLLRRAAEKDLPDATPLAGVV